MPITDRKAQIAAWKERKIIAGIYALRCAASGEIWVGRAPDISTIQTRLWFTLKHGSSTHRTLQSAWNSHGETAISFEILESFAPDETGPVPEFTLRSRHDHWLQALAARRV